MKKIRLARSWRVQKLIEPRLQLRLTAWFVALSAVSLLLQFVLFTSVLSGLFVDLPGGSALWQRFTEGSQEVLLKSLVMVLPLTAAVGILSTFRIAGAVYAMRRYLAAVRQGTATQECRLRKGDELQELCRELNEATATLRSRASEPAAGREVA